MTTAKLEKLYNAWRSASAALEASTSDWDAVDAQELETKTAGIYLDAQNELTHQECKGVEGAEIIHTCKNVEVGDIVDVSNVIGERGHSRHEMQSQPVTRGSSYNNVFTDKSKTMCVIGLLKGTGTVYVTPAA